VIFTSDNGPWLSYGNHAGSAGPLREGKGTAWEGGQRVPCIARWPGTIPAGSVCDTPAMHLDLVPTVAALIGAKLPAHRIDGKDIRALFETPATAPSPHEGYCLYWGNDLHAVRSGQWSLHFPHAYRSLMGEPGNDGIPGDYEQRMTGFALYDLVADLGQTTDVKDRHPEVFEKLKAFGEAYDREIKANARPVGSL